MIKKQSLVQCNGLLCLYDVVVLPVHGLDIAQLSGVDYGVWSFGS